MEGGGNFDAGEGELFRVKWWAKSTVFADYESTIFACVIGVTSLKDQRPDRAVGRAMQTSGPGGFEL